IGIGSPASGSALEDLPNAPMAMVSRISHPPKIDGRDNDACWGHTVAIKDFVIFGSMTPASPGTTVRLAYDNQNFYVLVHCEEPLLKTADQRRSDVRAKATERDGPVLNDDSFLIFIQPKPNHPAVYEFTV